MLFIVLCLDSSGIHYRLLQLDLNQSFTKQFCRLHKIKNVSFYGFSSTPKICQKIEPQNWMAVIAYCTYKKVANHLS